MAVEVVWTHQSWHKERPEVDRTKTKYREGESRLEWKQVLSGSDWLLMVRVLDAAWPQSQLSAPKSLSFLQISARTLPANGESFFKPLTT